MPEEIPDLDRTAAAIREVLIESTDIIPAGSEPFVGWSYVLANRIAQVVSNA